MAPRWPARRVAQGPRCTRVAAKTLASAVHGPPHGNALGDAGADQGCGLAARGRVVGGCSESAGHRKVSRSDLMHQSVMRRTRPRADRRGGRRAPFRTAHVRRSQCGRCTRPAQDLSVDGPGSRSGKVLDLLAHSRDRIRMPLKVAPEAVLAQAGARLMNREHHTPPPARPRAVLLSNFQSCEPSNRLRLLACGKAEPSPRSFP